MMSIKSKVAEMLEKSTMLKFSKTSSYSWTYFSNQLDIRVSNILLICVDILDLKSETQLSNDQKHSLIFSQSFLLIINIGDYEAFKKEISKYVEINDQEELNKTKGKKLIFKMYSETISI